MVGITLRQGGDAAGHFPFKIMGVHIWLLIFPRFKESHKTLATRPCWKLAMGMKKSDECFWPMWNLGEFHTEQMLFPCPLQYCTFLCGQSRVNTVGECVADHHLNCRGSHQVSHHLSHNLNNTINLSFRGNSQFWFPLPSHPSLFFLSTLLITVVSVMKEWVLN